MQLIPLSKSSKIHLNLPHHKPSSVYIEISNNEMDGTMIDLRACTSFIQIQVIATTLPVLDRRRYLHVKTLEESNNGTIDRVQNQFIDTWRRHIFLMMLLLLWPLLYISSVSAAAHRQSGKRHQFTHCCKKRSPNTVGQCAKQYFEASISTILVPTLFK